MSYRPLSEKEERVYTFLKKEIERSLPPTVREICSATGIRSTSTVHGILAALEDEGYIERDRYNSRAIRIAGVSSSAQVPVLGRVTAGKPILAVEEIEEYIPFPIHGLGDGLFALRVDGLSMRDAGILDGDIVVADKDAASGAGDIIVALIDDEATVKRLAFQNGRPVLMPENPDFSPIYPETLTVLGRVVGSIRRY